MSKVNFYNIKFPSGGDEECDTYKSLNTGKTKNNELNKGNESTGPVEDIKNSRYSGIIDDSTSYNDKNLDSLFAKFKYFTFKKESKIFLINLYIDKFIINIYRKLKNKIEEKNSENQTDIIDEYSFDSLLRKLSHSKEDIKEFFNIFDYIKNKLTSITNADYILFLTRFLELIGGPKKRLNAWKFINYLYMIKIYNEMNEMIKKRIIITAK